MATRIPAVRVALLLLPLAAAAPAARAAGPARPASPVGTRRYFEPNAGQADASARFLLRMQQGTVFFTPSEIVLTSATDQPLRVRFLGGNPAPRIEAGAALPGKVNYLLGNEPRRWRTGLATYSGITYADLYPGVALAYATEGRPLKGTYTVAPGVDPSRIRWRYEGGEARLDAGRLHVTPHGGGATLTEDAPVAWQDLRGRRVPVSARYTIAEDGSLGFVIGAYDRTRPLTIDPVITYSSYLGGARSDLALGIAVDRAGNAYIAGQTASSDFPTLNAPQASGAGPIDAFVARFNPDGTLAYSTYLGGSYLDWATDIAVDGEGNAYVTGFTGSANFPTHMAFQPVYAGGWDAFVTKLSHDGSTLLYSTYLGGSSEENRTNAGFPGSIAVDQAGSAYVAGDTQSADFPTVAALQPNLRGIMDAFVSKLTPDGTALVYSTYLGGERAETAWGIAVDGAGSAVVTGDTVSLAFPTVNAHQPQCAASVSACWDVFVSKLDPAGSALVYSTYLGGNDMEYIDRGIGITTDAAGAAYVTGSTGSPNFPIRNAYQPFYGGQVDAFVAKFSTGGTLVSSTFLGGSNSEVGYGIAVHSRPGSRDTLPLGVYVSGLTISSDFPTVNPIQATLGAYEDSFVTRYTGGISGVVYSTYLGGTNGREEYGSQGIGLDGEANVYITGGSSATDYPAVNAHQPAVRGFYDAVVTRIDDTPTTADSPAGSERKP
jgi:hypothetical protein